MYVHVECCNQNWYEVGSEIFETDSENQPQQYHIKGTFLAGNGMECMFEWVCFMLVKF